MRTVTSVDVAAFTVPTATPESDGTLEWDSTTAVVVEAHAEGKTGLGYTYAPAAAAAVVREKLAPLVTGADAARPAAAWARMWHEVRNAGQSGLVSMAISAVDQALWDLHARLLDIPLAVALGAVHDRVPIYGSGGFTSYSMDQLAEQLGGWADQGIPRVKMKTGRDPQADRERLRVARAAIGPDTELFVDANGAFTRKQALAWAERYAEQGITWFEEPVSSDDLEGLRLLRERGPAGLDIAAGEYGWHLPGFQRMLDAGAVDCLQADVTRCGGLTAFLRVGALCDARSMDLSAHCAPQISAHACTAIWHLRHLEYFADHIRVEHLLFDGCLEPQGGALVPDLSRPGNGLTLRGEEAARWRAD